MQDPKQEIPSIITTLTRTKSALHPLCRSNSREEILGVYQWYRIMSPQTKSRVLSVIYDEALNVLIVEVVQIFHIRYNPFPPGESRLNVRLTLRELKGLHYIARQEDFYHPSDIVALLAPPLIRLADLSLSGASVASNVCAWMFRMINFTGGGLEGANVSLRELFEGLKTGSVCKLRASIVRGTKGTEANYLVDRDINLQCSAKSRDD